MNTHSRIIAVFMLTVLFFLAASTSARTVDELRAEDEKRTYLFYYDQDQFGKLESVFKGDKSFKGTKGYLFEEKLSLDYTVFAGENGMVQEITNRHYVDKDGFYIGDDMTLMVNDLKVELTLKHERDSILGVSEQGDRKQILAMPQPGPIMALDNNMIDQYEIFCAMLSPQIGDTIIDTIFVPQMQTSLTVRAVVEDFQYTRYGNMFDSAFVYRFLEPIQQTVYANRAGKVLKINQDTQKIRVVLSENPLDRLRPKQKAITIGDILHRTPIYILFLVIGFLCCLPFILKNYKRPETYIMLVLGALMYVLIRVTYIPLQTWYTNAHIIPGMQSGGSLYYYGFISALLTGVFQESFKLIPIALYYFIRRPGKRVAIAVGVFAAVGFGILEACFMTGAAYQSGALDILSGQTFEQALMILFHTLSGVLLGYGVYVGWKRLVIFWPALIVIHTAISYLIVFYHRGDIEIELIQIIIALIDVLLLLATYLLTRGGRRG